MNYSRTEVNALLDEHERAVRYLLSILKRWKEGDLNKSIPHDSKVTYGQVLNHVIGSGYYGYFVWIQQVLGWEVESPPVNKEEVEELCDLRKQMELLEKMTPYARRALKNLTNHDLYPTMYLSNWGAYYTIDGMLEHAIVHVWRHIRQLERAEAMLIRQKEQAG